VVVEDEDDYIVLFDEEAYLTRCSKSTTATCNEETMEIDGRFLKQLLRSQCFSEYMLSLHPNHAAAV
jgi:hypothetical protein